MRLSTKIAIIFLGLAVVSTILINHVSKQIIRDNFTETTINHQNQIAKVTIDKIDRILYQKFLDISTIASDPEISRNINDQTTQSDSGKMVKYMQHYNLTTGPWNSLDVMSITDKKVIFSSEKNRIDKPISLNKVTAYQEAVKKGSTYFSDVIISNDTGKPTIIYSSPIKNNEIKNNPIIGVVIGELAWKTISETLNDLDSGAAIYNKDGLLIASNNKEGFIFNNEKINNSGETDENIVSLAPQLGYLDYTGSNWVLSLSTPAKTAFAPLEKLLFSMSIILVLSFTAISIILLSVIEKIVISPIMKLTDTSKSIIKGNLYIKANVDSEDEIGELATSFNQMTQNLIIQKENINKIVEKRTEQLQKLNQFMVGRELQMAELKKEIKKYKTDDQKN
ncbi:HAMP domain-containing protein [Patescibacteria group bacterium]|nr:HAMP domain-containing protein [Patescibacteria group bacterium]